MLIIKDITHANNTNSIAESTVIPKALNQPVLKIYLYTHNHANGATKSANIIDNTPTCSIISNEPITTAMYIKGAVSVASIEVVNLTLPMVRILAEMYTGMDRITQAPIVTAINDSIISPKPVSIKYK